MRAVVVREHGGVEALRLERLPVPEPGPCQVRVRVEAVALNFLDVWVRRGVPGHTFPLPLVPGCDVAGTVDALGPGAEGLAVGDAVVLLPGVSCGRCPACRQGREPLCRAYGILGETRDGGCAEFVVVPAANVFPRPAGLDAVAAAALPLTFLTAWHMLAERAAVKPGEQVLVHAAGSGVSTAAIQIARLHGARVMAVAGSRAKAELARELGAEEAVDASVEDFAAAARRWTAKRGVDVAVDHVGKETFDRTLRCLAKGGRYVFCGATSGFEMVSDFRLVFFKSLSILGSTMGGGHELAAVLGHVGAGRLRPVVDTVLPLEDVAEGHARLEGRRVAGKVVLRVS
jgi:NADPH:quinone reductase-like Zn-dependent oxidoreductase